MENEQTEKISRAAQTREEMEVEEMEMETAVRVNVWKERAGGSKEGVCVQG